MQEQKRRGETKNLTPPLLISNPTNQKKLIKNKGSSFINNLVQDQKLQTKEFFILWIKSSSLSKTILFLSFQTVQKRHNGAIIQAFLRFLPTKEPCQPIKVSLIDNGRTHVTPKIANNNSHKTLAMVQWIRIWSINSSSEQQRNIY